MAEDLTKKVGGENPKREQRWLYKCPNCSYSTEENSPNLRGSIHCQICGHMYDPPIERFYTSPK